MKKPKIRPQQRVHDSIGCRSLIVIDQEPIRKKALAEFKRAQKALLKNRQELSHYLNVVRPSFRHWMTGLAGEKMEKVATLQNQLRERAIFLDRIENWSMKKTFRLEKPMSLQIRNMKKQKIRRIKGAWMRANQILNQTKTQKILSTRK
jgi:hypothetical protein